MKTTTTPITLLLLAALIAACSNEPMHTPPDATPDDGRITFDIGFANETRANTDAGFNTTWQDGDQIGLFAVEHGSFLSPNVTDNVLNNVCLTYSSADGSWSGPAYWPRPATGITALNFYAYYPYDPGITNPEDIAFNVQTDQQGDNYTLSDLMIASTYGPPGGWTRDDGPVSLNFIHQMAMVQVNLTNTAGGIDPNEIAVTLRTAYTGARLNLLGIVNPSLSGNPNPIKMHRVEQKGNPEYREKYTFRALVPGGQIIAANAAMLSITNGDLLLSTMPDQRLYLQRGNAHIFTETIPPHIHKVLIPKGEFKMGSPLDEPERRNDETQHDVILTQDFYMSKYPITFAQYDAFCTATGRTPPDDWYMGRRDRPVINVSWQDAKDYCDWVTQTTDMQCRLPTEAEWEYACRGGQEQSLPFGIGDGTMLYAEMANFDGNHPYDQAYGGTRPAYDGSDGHENTFLIHTTPVGSYGPNGYGLYDMHGNVYEWCADGYDENYGIGDLTQPATDPQGPDTGWGRVIRGGCFTDYGTDCRSASRNGFSVDTHLNVGFRVVFLPK